MGGYYTQQCRLRIKLTNIKGRHKYHLKNKSSYKIFTHLNPLKKKVKESGIKYTKNKNRRHDHPTLRIHVVNIIRKTLTFVFIYKCILLISDQSLSFVITYHHDPTCQRTSYMSMARMCKLQLCFILIRCKCFAIVLLPFCCILSQASQPFGQR